MTNKDILTILQDTISRLSTTLQLDANTYNIKELCEQLVDEINVYLEDCN